MAKHLNLPALEHGAQSRVLYPVPEARELLGGISHTTFYKLVNEEHIRLIKLGRRSFVSADEIRRIAGGEAP